jgi:hypothetical protein
LDAAPPLSFLTLLSFLTGAALAFGVVDFLDGAALAFDADLDADLGLD